MRKKELCRHCDVDAATGGQPTPIGKPRSYNLATLIRDQLRCRLGYAESPNLFWDVGLFSRTMTRTRQGSSFFHTACARRRLRYRRSLGRLVCSHPPFSKWLLSLLTTFSGIVAALGNVFMTDNLEAKPETPSDVDSISQSQTDFGFIPIPKRLRYDPDRPFHFGMTLNIAFGFASTFSESVSLFLRLIF